MGLLSLFRQIYDLDTIDTRFTTPSSVPYKTVIDARDDPAAASKERAARWDTSKPAITTKPSLWKTPEFIAYLIILALAIPVMLYIPYDASKSTDPKYKTYERFLSPGWVPGRKIDISDAQYRTFRGNFPYLLTLLIFHPLLRRLYNTFVYPVSHPGPQTSGKESPRPTLEEADERLAQRTTFDFRFAIVFLFALHGISVFKVLTILYLNYQIATALPRQYVPTATWAFNVGILFANDIFHGYRFGDLAVWVAGPSSQVSLVSAPSSLVAWGRWLDSFGGLLSRWEILFNLTVLRMISFNMDYYWSLDRRSYSPVEKQIDPSSLSEKDRIATPAHARDYTFRNFVAYAVYAPLYLTGPIITFNDYVSQSRWRPASIEAGRTARYAVRFVACLLAMELLLHYNYVGAIAKSSPRWSDWSGAHLSLLAYFNLFVIWLKLLLPWRLARLWALNDGLDPPENMVRCVTDNISTLSFWRGWHRSFYRWSLRYIYIPLGGSSFRTPRAAARSVSTYVLVFTFVAVWHDVELRLLIWGWLIVLFMLPEMLVLYALAPPAARARWEDRHPRAYRLLAGLGYLVNILMMMAANLVGFAFGVDGLKSILSGIFSDFNGIMFFLWWAFVLFCSAQIMREVREAEKRRGIDLKC